MKKILRCMLLLMLALCISVSLFSCKKNEEPPEESMTESSEPSANEPEDETPADDEENKKKPSGGNKDDDDNDDDDDDDDDEKEDTTPITSAGAHTDQNWEDDLLEMKPLPNDPYYNWNNIVANMKAQGTIAVNNDLKAKTEGQEIDIYILAGQSNASGFSYMPTGFIGSDADFTNGYSNVLYSGNAASTTEGGEIALFSNIETLTKTKAGFGRYDNYFGPEVGMAEALSTYYTGDNMAGVIKFAAGGTPLCDVNSERVPAAGNWTPPSYVEKYGANVGQLTGGLYRLMIQQIVQSIAEYEAHGYTVNIKGFCWAQGEADKDRAGEYAEVFSCLVNDVREDVGAIVGKDLSAMPVFFNELSSSYHLKHNNGVNGANGFLAMQNALPDTIDNLYIVKTSPFGVGTTGTSDKSHLTCDDMFTMGQMMATQLLKVCKGVTVPDGQITMSSDVVATVYDSSNQLIGSYPSLSYAINSAPAGSTIKLEKDITLYGNLNINNLNAITIDGNGHTIISYSETHGIRLVDCADNVTFTNFNFSHQVSGKAAWAVYTNGAVSGTGATLEEAKGSNS